MEEGDIRRLIQEALKEVTSEMESKVKKYGRKTKQLERKFKSLKMKTRH